MLRARNDNHFGGGAENGTASRPPRFSLTRHPAPPSTNAREERPKRRGARRRDILRRIQMDGLAVPSLHQGPAVLMIVSGTPFAPLSVMTFPLTALALSGILVTVSDALPGDGSSSLQTEDCVRAWSEARPRYPGYDHIVHLESSCTVNSACSVWTNVNPQVILAKVPAGQSVEVLTFMASPAREFTATVECKADE